MIIDERARHQLFQKLEAVLGPDEANILMEHLPPVGWADVATKHDLDALAELLRAEMRAVSAELRSEMALLREGFSRDLLDMSHRFTRWTLGSMIGVGGLVFAAVRFV